MLAAQCSPYPEVIAMLIRAGADPAARQQEYTEGGGEYSLYPSHNWTALHFAASANPNPAVVAELLKHKPEVNAADGAGYTPLHLACQGKDGQGGHPVRLEHVRLLLAAGADPDKGDRKDSQTPLMAAIFYGDAAKVLAMLPKSALETADRHGDTALSHAVKHDRHAIAGELLRRGARVSRQVVLNVCAYGNDMDPTLLRSLLTGRDVDLNLLSQNGRNFFLHTAAHSGSHKVLEALFQAGARLDGNSYLLDAMPLNTSDNHQAISVLLRHGDNSDAGQSAPSLRATSFFLTDGDNPDTGQETPLIRAIKLGKMECLRILLKSGANPNLSYEQGRTPLLAAMEPDSPGGASGQEIVHLLLKAGADVNAVNREGHCAIMLAIDRSVWSGRFEEIRMLLKAGARLNQVYPCGETPLTYAIRREYRMEENVALLLAAGANPALPNAAGQTPAMLAEPYPEVKPLLQKSR
jgi:ankyrin repeat protein